MAKVLIVDDSEFFRSAYGNALAAKGFDVEIAVDGKSAIEQMLAAPPQLIFLDLIMPGMSGEDVLREMTKQESLNGIPVIMLTSFSAEVVGEDLLKLHPLAGYMKKDEALDEDVVKKAQEVLGTFEKPFDPTAAV